jgi:hypothetical protein
MNPTRRIGRYLLPILNVVAIQERPEKTGWRKLLFWQKPGFDVALVNGAVIHFTYQEKADYEQALAEHVTTMRVLGMCASAGLRATSL